MKKITQLLSCIILLASLPGKAQVSFCPGTTTVITATNPQNLTSPSYSMNPGNITSANGNFTVGPASSTTYTLYTTGLNGSSAIVTTSFALQVNPVLSTFGVTSPQNFSLGCATKSVCTVNIINGQGYMGGTVTYTLIPPGNPSIVVTPTPSTQYTVNFPGTWTVAVVDNVSGCVTYSPINITQNITPPPVSVMQSPATCTSPAVLSGTSNALATYVWQPMNFANNSVTITANTAIPTQSVNGSATLFVTDISNACSSSTVVTVYQNLYAPNAQIAATPTSCAMNGAFLVNQSSTGIPPGTFATSNPISGYWEGPSMTPTIASTYYATVSGVYTMTAIDRNNGCTSTKTVAVTMGPNAVFTHTVNGAQVDFSDASTGTNGGTTYFWDFGDGSYTSQQNPSHTYSNAGSYIVKFKIMQSFFCKDSVMQSITVSGIPCAANSSFTLAPTGTAQVWNASPLYPWNISAASWTWGDGSSSSILYTSHTYSAAGLYNICLTVTVNCVASSSSCSTYSVYKVTQEAMILKINVVEPEHIETGIDENPNTEIVSWSIVPNPNEGDFTVNLPSTKVKDLRFSLYDLTGRLIHSEVPEQNSTSISVRNKDLPAGLYIVKLEGKGLKLTKRIVIYH